MRALRKQCDFGALSVAERRLLDELDTGEDIVVGDGQLPSTEGCAERSIRAAFIRYLLLESSEELRAGGTRLHEKGVRLVGATIDGALDLQSSVIVHDLEFKNCRFSETPIFDGARIEGLCLKGSVLPGLRAEWLVARGRISLDGVEANGEVRLVGAKIRGQLDCDDCRISNPGKTALSLVRADLGAAFFLRGKASIDGLLNLSGARLRAIVDEPRCWPKRGQLDLSGCVYEGFMMKAPISAKARLEWLQLQCDVKAAEFSPQPFEQCAFVLRQSGHADDARAVLIEKERLQRQAERSRASVLIRQAKWLRDCLLGGTIRYGYAPMLAVAWLVGFWILGTTICGFVYQERAFKPGISILRRAEWMACAGTQADSWSAASLREDLVGRALPQESQLECFLRQPETRSYPRFSAAVYALDTLLPVVSLGMDDYWSPDETKRWGALGRVYVWCQIIVGWALTFLAVAGFSGLVKTK